MVSNLESIKEIEEELARVRLGIIEDEKEYKALQNKINTFYIGFPLGLAYSIWGLWFCMCLYTGEGGKNAFSILGIIFLASFLWSLFMLFGTSAGQRTRRLYYQSIQKKKKKKQLERKLKQLVYLSKVKGEK